MRAYGPAVGEPPPAVDPRRWGSVIGVAGGLVFVLSYAPALGTPVATTLTVLAVGLALGVLHGHYVRPRALGVLQPLRPLALVVYVGCVVGELALIASGSVALTGAGREDLRPALIAAVVGLHFLPFSWAFGERLFRVLGSLLLGIGLVGLGLGAADVDRAADVAATLAGFVLLGLLGLLARPGTGAPPKVTRTTRPGALLARTHRPARPAARAGGAARRTGGRPGRRTAYGRRRDVLRRHADRHQLLPRRRAAGG